MAAKKLLDDPVFDFIVVGGGIAAVSCAEYLAFLKEDIRICLISSSDLIKTVCNIRNLTRNLTEFDVVEKPLCTLSNKCTNVTVVRSAVVSFDPTAHKVATSCNKEYHYKKLCICSGARPKLITAKNQHVLGLRDVQSIKHFQDRLSTANQVAVIGNGGIALELVYDLSGCNVIWVIKDDNIGNAYLDKGASQFFLPNLELESDILNDEKIPRKEIKKISSQELDYSAGSGEHAAALGHDWKKSIKIKGNREVSKCNVHIEYNSEVAAILTPEEYGKLSKHCVSYPEKNHKWNIYVQLTNKKIFGCDFVVSATGVVPNTEAFTKCAVFDITSDGGLKVDDHMSTSICDVFAAGDVCSASWDHSDTWMQMRLWTQGNQMGVYAAKCMMADLNGETIMMDFCFELFAHVTCFFGYKVVLLGKFNGQGLANDYKVLLRCTKGEEYVKIIVHQGRVHGALLIGETDLEETFENLILNQIDISAFEEDLLDPNIDIEDYFD